MAKTTQTVTLVTVVEGLTTATEALNNTAKAIFEFVSGEAEAVAPKTTPASKKAPKVEEPEVETDGADELEEMTIQELRKKAKELGLKAGGSKASLIEAIREELDGAEEEPEEEEDEEEESEDEEEEEEEIDLEELSADELVSFIEENEIGDVPAKKKKEKAEAYADRLRAFIEENLADEEDEDESDEEEEDEDSEDEEEEEVDLEELSDEELVELAEEHEVEVPYTGKGKKKKLDREALIEALSELLADDEEEEDEEEEDEDEEDEDDSDDDSEDEDEDDEDEEELTPEDLEEMSDDELKELCEDFELDYGKKFNRKKAIKILVEYMESDDEDEE